MPTLIIRNGDKLCAGCARKGCNRYVGTKGDEPPNEVETYISDEDCICCGPDFEIDDGFGY